MSSDLNPYDPPSTAPQGPGSAPPSGAPAVVIWFKLYAGLLGLLFFLVMGLGILLLSPMVAEELAKEGEKGVPVGVIGALYAIMGALFFIFALLPLFFPRRSWVWIYDLVLICLGMTGCTIVFSIPLLIFWIRPETKAYFSGTRTVSTL